jgi:hypothetical protein
MTINLTQTESEEYFNNSLCNALGYMSGYGLQLEYNDTDYKAAKAKLRNPCFEDVLMQILKDGKSLTLVDVECEGEYTRSITLKEVHERVQKTPLDHLQDMIDETDDATTADVILQTVFYEDIIFG